MSATLSDSRNGHQTAVRGRAERAARPLKGGNGSTQQVRTRVPAQPYASVAAVIVVAGTWQLLLSIVCVVATLSWWPLVERSAAGAVTATWLGATFTLTAASAAVLLGVTGAVAGSLVHTITIFSSRVGRKNLEASYLWWYLLRPFASALLALLFVSAVHSGMVALGGPGPDNKATVALVAGGLAGLFTDAVLQRLRGILGATSTQLAASEQSVPLAPPPTTGDRA